MTDHTPSIWSDTAEEAEFRAGLRSWLSTSSPTAPLPSGADARADALHQWHRTLAGAGYIGLSLPAQFGGRGLSAIYESIFNEELGLAGAPQAPAIGHLAHALSLYGNDQQRDTHLRTMLSGDTRWCQGFSEPDAGSDLGALRTVARLQPTGDTLVVSGQKIWTSLAVYADWCLLLARTDAAATSTARALSMLIVPMSSTGITCRAIRTSWDTREFAEVFFDDVELPASAVLGEIGEGWAIAGQLLAFERGPADIGWVARLRRLLTEAAAAHRRTGIVLDPAQRDAWARAHVELRVLELHVRRSLAQRRLGHLPGPEGSLDKLLLTRVDQLVNEVVLMLRGADALLTGGGELDQYLNARAASVFGGTSQIQRNVVGERVLGLPREPRAG
ncbi:MAG: caiA 6 [Ilumatobacteraceae bacterium]|nr:caiA 6 [Ilumatobacteraceae bacterium]